MGASCRMVCWQINRYENVAAGKTWTLEGVSFCTDQEKLVAEME